MKTNFQRVSRVYADSSASTYDLGIDVSVSVGVGVGVGAGFDRNRK